MIYSDHQMEQIATKQDEEQALEGLESSFPINVMAGLSWSLVRYILWDRKGAMCCSSTMPRAVGEGAIQDSDNQCHACFYGSVPF